MAVRRQKTEYQKTAAQSIRARLGGKYTNVILVGQNEHCEQKGQHGPRDFQFCGQPYIYYPKIFDNQYTSDTPRLVHDCNTWSEGKMPNLLKRQSSSVAQVD